MNLDALDLKVLYHLMRQGRMTWSELAGLLDLSSPAAADRVRRMEDRQVITGYSAQVMPDAVGCHLTAFVAVTLDRPEHRFGFLATIQSMTDVQECHHMAGDDDYWLKVRCSGTKALEKLISNDLKSIPGVIKTRTTIVLSTLKETSILPLPALSSSQSSE